MATTIQWFLDKYGESHRNDTNKAIHWICVPAIMFSLFALLYSIPFPFTEKTWYANWAVPVLAAALMFYLRLSLPMFIGFAIIGAAMLTGAEAIHNAIDRSNGTMAIIALLVFAAAWVGQFIGHKIEGKKPSFLQDLKFLLIGPAWLLHFIYRQLGIRY